MRTPQSGLNRGSRFGRGNVLVRGVVIATYFADEEDRPSTQSQYETKAVAVDVLTYGGPRRFFIPRAMVVQARHGLNDHTGLWIPRPTLTNLVTRQPPRLSRTDEGAAEDPRDFDGDHVIVQFLENDPMQAIVTGAIPHPHALTRMTKVDGETLSTRFRGVVARVDKDGNAALSTTGANSGLIDASGREPPIDDAAHGNINVDINRNAKLTIRGVDVNGANETFSLVIEDGQIQIRLANGESLTITGNGATTIANLGNAAVSAAIAERLQTLWAQLNTWATTQLSVPTGTGPSGPSLVPIPAWDALIASTHLKIPDSP